MVRFEAVDDESARCWSNRVVPWSWNGILNTQVMYLVEMLAGPMHVLLYRGVTLGCNEGRELTNYWERGQCATRGTHHCEALRDTDTILPFLAYQAWSMPPAKHTRSELAWWPISWGQIIMRSEQGRLDKNLWM